MFIVLASVGSTTPGANWTVLRGLFPVVVKKEGQVYDPHPSPVAAAFRMESISLQIMIDMYLVVAREDETPFLQWVAGLTHLSR